MDVISLSGIRIDSIEVVGPTWTACSEDLVTSASSWVTTLEDLTLSQNIIRQQ